ncbi:MAG: cytochrome c oxidase assembly protein [Polyangiaceae bacterium]
MTTSKLLAVWDLNPLVLAGCLAALLTYGAYSRPWAWQRASYFAGALLATVLALMSPIAVLAKGVLFSAHMLQHLLLVLVVPPLVLLALPRPAAASTHKDAGQRAALRPWHGWLLGVGAMWLWHAPTLCNAATSNGAVRALQTLSLLGMGSAFWWPILAPKQEARVAPLGGVLYLFAACTACTALGVLVTFSPIAVCSAYTHPSDSLGLLSLVRDQWGITCANDQRIGGLLMWVPACLIYGSAILGSLARWYRSDQANALTAGASDSQAVT